MPWVGLAATKGGDNQRGRQGGGFDRLRFRGARSLINAPGGMTNFLCRQRVLRKDFPSYAGDTTDALLRAVSDAEVGRWYDG